MKKQSHHFLLLGLLILLSGCATPTTYHWGEYEEQVYVMYAAPDQGTVASQLDVLELDIEKARLKNQPLAPGIRAHMGFLYFQAGRNDEARQAFEAEKAAFPESAQLMDRFIGKLGKKHA
jgi:hypothetical protein